MSGTRIGVNERLGVVCMLAPHPRPRQRLERRAARSVWLRVARHVSHRSDAALDPGLLAAARARLAHCNALVVDAELRAEAGFDRWTSRVDAAIASMPRAEDVDPVEAKRLAWVHLDSVDRSWNLVAASRPHVLAWPTWFEQLQQTVGWARRLARRSADDAIVERADRVAGRVAAGLDTARHARVDATLERILEAHDSEVERLEREYGMRGSNVEPGVDERRHLWRLADRLFELEGQLAELHDPFTGPGIGHRRRRVLDLLNRVESERQDRLRDVIDGEPDPAEPPDAG